MINQQMMIDTSVYDVELWDYKPVLLDELIK